MKKTAVFVLSVLLCVFTAATVFADDIYIVDDADDEYIPNNQTTTTTAPAETTTASGISGGLESIFGDGSDLQGYLDDFSGLISGGLDSILSGFDIGGQAGQTTAPAETTTRLQSIFETTTKAQTTAGTTSQTTTETTTAASETTTKQEVASVLIVNGSSEENSVLSGSTLTILVFVAAVLILVMVIGIVLVVMTRRTEFNAAVMNKSTLPNVEQPRTMSQFSNDDIADDGENYADIAYWNDENHH